MRPERAENGGRAHAGGVVMIITEHGASLVMCGWYGLVCVLWTVQLVVVSSNPVMAWQCVRFSTPVGDR